jgi:hypothetical protein
MAKPEVHILGARDLLIGTTAPGDSAADAACRQFLIDLMLANPGGIPGKSKPDFLRECQLRFGIPKRSFDRIWAFCIDRTGARAFGKRGPRGPQKNRRRRN